MRVLLDTHALLWLLGQPRLLSSRTQSLLSDPQTEIFVSVVSLWEIVVKRRVGKLDADFAAILAQFLPPSKLQQLALSSQHLLELDRLPFHEDHRDPFDHLLIAQAIADQMAFVSRDQNASRYAVQVIAP